MIRTLLTAAIACSATSLAAQDIEIKDAYVPLAPPGVMTHAAYLTLENTGTQPRSLIGVKAEGYGMAHVHQSKEHSGVAVMSMVHQLDIAAGQTVMLEPGGFHIMLMHPMGPSKADKRVPITLQFANGEELTISAPIEARHSGS